MKFSDKILLFCKINNGVIKNGDVMQAIATVSLFQVL